jgi:hypothetical protein
MTRRKLTMLPRRWDWQSQPLDDVRGGAEIQGDWDDNRDVGRCVTRIQSRKWTTPREKHALERRCWVSARGRALSRHLQSSAAEPTVLTPPTVTTPKDGRPETAVPF